MRISIQVKIALHGVFFVSHKVLLEIVVVPLVLSFDAAFSRADLVLL